MPRRFPSLRRTTTALLATALLALASRTAARADTVVRNCADDAELSAAVAAGGKITFDCFAANPSATIPVRTTLVVTTAATIDGADRVTLDAGGKTRLFDVVAQGSLDLRRITLTLGAAPDDGGAVRNAGFLALDGARIARSSAGGGGGAIATSGPVDVTGSEIDGCTAINGGGIAAAGSNARVTIADSSLHGNHATAGGSGRGNGGAVAVTDGASVAIFSTVLVENEANATGGALAVGAFESSASLETSTVAFNRAGAGGGLFNLNAALTVRDSTFWSNAASAGGGGGIANEGGTATLIDVTLSDNRALGGGGLSNDGGTASLTNATIAGNSATNLGGGLANSSARSSVLALTNVLVGGSKSGGNCFFASKPRTVDHSMSSDATCAFGGGRDNVKLKLGRLETNGGPTLTRRLLSGSPAIDAGSTNGCPATDQRFVARPEGASCDIGAVEFTPCDGTPPPPALISAEPRFGVEASVQASVKTLDFRFDWVGPDCASRFELVVRQDSRSGPIVWSGHPTRATEQTVPGVALDREYFWSVRACNTAGCTESRRKRLAALKFA